MLALPCGTKEMVTSRLPLAAKAGALAWALCRASLGLGTWSTPWALGDLGIGVHWVGSRLLTAACVSRHSEVQHLLQSWLLGFLPSLLLMHLGTARLPGFQPSMWERCLRAWP